MTEDPVAYLSRGLSKLNSWWLRATYPFIRFGARTAIHFSCDVDRGMSKFVALGDDVYLAQDVWINVACDMQETGERIVLSNGCKIGRRSTISCKNQILLGQNVLLAPAVLLMDHNHQYLDTSRPIMAQGVTTGGKITIEENCWLGYCCVVLCMSGELTIGRNSVIGANSVVTKSVPPFSIVGGNPGRVVKRYDPESQQWIKA